MVPKIIHLCWFSNGPFPVEVKVCMDTWKKLLPDYSLRVWGYEDAKAIDIPFLQEALEARRWAFAADVVRFYAVYTEGGVYMDSDIFLYQRFDRFVPQGDDAFVTFHEKTHRGEDIAGVDDYNLQAAFFIATKGSTYCKAVLDYYLARHYVRPDGSRDETISPRIMREAARKYGYVMKDEEMDLGVLKIYPTHYLAPIKQYERDEETFGVHRAHGGWRKRRFGRRLEIKAKHLYNVVKYFLFKR